MNVRAHPTVRPFALALGVFPRAGLAESLDFLGPAARDVSAALFADTLGVLSTFPVRHRVVFTHGKGAVTEQVKLPATWREMQQRGSDERERVVAAFDDLFTLGAEAVLLVSGDAPVLPLGTLFDGVMWLLPKSRMLICPADQGGLVALGAASKCEWLDQGYGLIERASAEHRAWIGSSSDLTARAKQQNLEVQMLDSTYHVGDRETLKRLSVDVQKGAFAPACRKLFERADLRAHL